MNVLLCAEDWGTDPENIASGGPTMRKWFYRWQYMKHQIALKQQNLQEATEDYE